ncbi:MAG: hypothetical protein IT429_26225 [Gemmataceae bacterium]|nr:hypothetical protein [Gemmataceae bacterium]
MSTFNYLFAFALLSTPPDVLDLAEPSKLHAPLGDALRAITLHLELLDPKEGGYVLAKAEDFLSDLKLLQGRYQELATAPPLAEARRFPNRDMAGDLLAFNRAYRDTLSNRLALDAIHAEELRAALTETDYLYRVWDMVRDARCEYYYITYRRQALQQLRDLVGPHAFYTGQLPPHVPMWRIPTEK